MAYDASESKMEDAFEVVIGTTNRVGEAIRIDERTLTVGSESSTYAPSRTDSVAVPARAISGRGQEIARAIEHAAEVCDSAKSTF
ncbi:MAG TPA: hypothetical protein VFU01_13475 [Gemmatimonadaceae bacterium]|nr:hypothetical protein [Gemmatimonadaceae bacterium]